VKKAAERVDENKPTHDGAAPDLSSSASFPRPQAQEILSATARIPKADLDTLLRRESGTRPAVSREDIARAMQNAEERLAGNEAPTAPPPPEDPHVRPTIDVFPRPGGGQLPGPEARPRAIAFEPPPPPSNSLHTPPPMVLTPARGMILPSPAATPLPVSRPSTPRWVAPALVAGALFFMTLTVALGFFLGRLSGH
jgi:hypothetical protein